MSENDYIQGWKFKVHKDTKILCISKTYYISFDKNYKLYVHNIDLSNDLYYLEIFRFSNNELISLKKYTCDGKTFIENLKNGTSEMNGLEGILDNIINKMKSPNN